MCLRPQQGAPLQRPVPRFPDGQRPVRVLPDSGQPGQGQEYQHRPGRHF